MIDSVVHSLDPIQCTGWWKGSSSKLHGINRQKDFWLVHSLQTISFGHTSPQFSNFSQLEMIGGIQRFFSWSQDVPYGHPTLYSISMNLLLYFKSAIILFIKTVIYFIKLWYPYDDDHGMALVHKYHSCIFHTTNNLDSSRHVDHDHSVLAHTGAP